MNLSSWFERLGARLLSASEEDRRLLGVRVRVSENRVGEPFEALFAKTEAALRLVQQHQPLRFRRLSLDQDLIWVRDQSACRAAFYSVPEPRIRFTLLDAYFVSAFSPEMIASSIVHEGVHAQVRRTGWLPHSQHDLAREERACRKAELRFGLSLPSGGQEVVERARASLLLSDEEVAPRLPGA